MDRENALFDERIRPDELQQVAFRNESSCVADQRHEQIVRLRWQRDAVSALQQLPLGDVQCELAEFVLLSSSHASFRRILAKPSGLRRGIAGNLVHDKGDHHMKQEILTQEELLTQAMRTLDIEAFERIYADDIMLTGVVGDNPCNKSTLLEEAKRGVAQRERAAAGGKPI